jgi:hypothetical protein
MGLMDKVKAQASQLAQKTQEAAQEGKAKLDQAQANRRGDALLRQLGAAVYAERTGRGTADSQSKIDKLISDISAHERENGLNLADQAPSGPSQPGFPADPASPFPGPAAGSGQDPSATSFPDQGSTSSPDTSGTSFPNSGQSFFPPPGDAPDSGSSSGFPPET